MEPFTAPHPHLPAMLRATVARRKDKPFLGSKKDGAWRWVSYGEFAARVDATRAALAQDGVAKGDRVGIIASNRVEWAVVAHAAWSLGAVVVPMYEVQLESDWKYILNDCGARALFVSSDRIAETIARIRPELPRLARVVVFDRSPREEGSFARWVGAAAGAPRPPEPSIAPDDEAVFIYTSGTTGNPKGVRLSHVSLVSNVSSTQGYIALHDDDRTLSILPWAHAGGVAELNAVTLHGISTGICEGVDKIVDNLAEVRPTWLVAVPRIWHRFHDAVQKGMLEKPKLLQRVFRRAIGAGRRRRDGEALSAKDKAALAIAERAIYPKIRERLGGRVRFTSCGAAALSVDVAHFLENLGIQVLEVYGLTEASAVATAMPPDERRLGSVGRAVPGVRIEIDKDTPGATGEEGEVVIFGHGVMLGYHALPEETARALRSDGGLRTGDLGRLDRDGFLYITGRLKEVYKLENGKFVAPVPIEEKIALSPYVAQVMLYGLNKPHNVALVVVDPGAVQTWAAQSGIELPREPAALAADPRVRKLLEEEIARGCAGFKGYERVVDFVVAHEPFTTANDMLTPTLKLKRRNVMARWGAELEKLYARRPAQASTAP